MAKKDKIVPSKGDPGYWEYMKTVGVKAIKDEREQKSKGGRPKKIETPEKLWEYACGYFIEVDNNPYHKQDFIRGGEMAGKTVELKTIMPYSWAGLDTYLFKHGIITDLDNYRNNTYNNYSEFQGVIARIKQTMFDQKFGGAAVGAFNASIIARDLQLAEITKSDVTAKVTTDDIDYSKLSPETLEELAKHSKLNAANKV